MWKRIATLTLLLLAVSCKETPPEPPPPPATLTLTAEDASSTEAWLKVTTTETPASVRLLRDGQRVSDFRLLSSDSLLFDEGLLPRRTYTYQLQKLGGDSSVIETSASVQVATMDTTSHEGWTWAIDTLGTHSSVLYDVAVVSDTLAYAVGEIFHRDSSENWTFFNLAKWNGRQWTLQRVYYQGTNIIHTRWILAFNERDIWITPYMHWDGTRFHEIPFDPIFSGVRTNKAWGTSSRNFYVVGDGGFIAHYNGSTWQRVESGTALDVYDIFGVSSLGTGTTELYAVAAKQFVNFDRRILKVTPVGVSVVSDSTIPYSLHGVWFKGDGPYYVVGSGMYRKRDLAQPAPWQWLHPGVTSYYTYAIRGNDVNDIFVCGSFGELLHFNGVTWRSFQTTPGFSSLEFYEISCRGNLVIAAGYMQPRAVAVIGRKQR